MSSEQAPYSRAGMVEVLMALWDMQTGPDCWCDSGDGSAPTHSPACAAAIRISRKYRTLTDTERAASLAPVAGAPDLQARVEQLSDAVAWALGEREEFPPQQPEGSPVRRYWWREELRRRAFGQPPSRVAPPSGAQTDCWECQTSDDDELCAAHRNVSVDPIAALVPMWRSRVDAFCAGPIRQCADELEVAIAKKAASPLPLPRATEPEAERACCVLFADTRWAEFLCPICRARASSAPPVSEQNPPRRAGHSSSDWIERVAADIRDLNPDYHDFESEVARHIRASAPPVVRPDALDIILAELAEAKAAILTGLTDPNASFPPARYRDEAHAYDVEAAVLRKYRQRLTAPASGPSETP